MYMDKVIGNFSFNTRNIIGIGGFGSVFQGVDESTSKKVAIKAIKKSKIYEDEYLMSSLVNEISILRKLKSQFVVRFLDTCETPSNYYIIQEYCQGGDLKKYLKEKRILSEKEALDILCCILQGYQLLLRNGVVHRDIKPANILIQNGIFKLADFGFATHSKGMLNSYVGTPTYMSPQVLRQEKYTNKCDIWSIGVLFYQCLYGETPWPKVDLTIDEYVDKICAEPFYFPSKTSVSEKCKDFISKCLIIDENERIDWNQVYEHPVFKELIFQQTTKERITKNNLKILIKSANINIAEEFQKLKAKKYISSIELFRFLQEINPAITRNQSDLIFNKHDQNNNIFISCENLETWLNNNQISTSSFNPTKEIKDSQPLILSVTEELQQEKGDQKNSCISYEESEVEEIEEFQVSPVLQPLSGPGVKILALGKCLRMF